MPRSIATTMDAKRAPALSPALRELIERAYRTKRTQARAIATRCQRLSPFYRRLSGVDLQHLREICLRVVTGFYKHTLIEGRMPKPTDLEPARRVARLRAAQGLPLTEMIGCYQCGLPVLWKRVIAIAGAKPAVRLELLKRVPMTVAALTLLTNAVTEAYVDERERLLLGRGQALDDFLRLLVADEAPLGLLEAHARSLAIRLDLPRTILLVRAAAAHDSAPSPIDVEAIRLALSRLKNADEIIIGRVQDGALALLPAAIDGNDFVALGDALRRLAYRAGVGGPGMHAAGVRRSAREALRALELGALVADGRPVRRYVEVALFDLVDIGSGRAEEFARGILGPLAERDANETYRKTLRELCRHGFRVKPAAAALGIHPHTLSYRLNQIRERYHVDVDQPDTRLGVQLALLILDAAGRPAPSPS